ncbi:MULTISPECIES: acylphosphatase [unclassified Oceanispirochaeta]|uniref:acylphosphatase n=1 Tax=unclassified Oceanispirochaeta TaxID=2635722 RepID=UPI000E09530E|nr:MULTISPECIES: acylphosphatase [unclassified Oceanispirochaeta]MBF9014183.1 acylphosphatase [Oceanispirochaeta sp. M2]NPD70673.1 acylphosphatase [Oceanispirochaeta sp. M1]RDG34433.1 acylphosphatase [Oceanispirochaeta sp. M1]
MDEVIRIKVKGRVQGVGFRYYTCRQGRRRGLCGWVRNEPDGSVLVHIQGSSEGLDDFRSWLKKGPPSARVESTVEIPAPFDESLIDFNVTY